MSLAVLLSINDHQVQQARLAVSDYTEQSIRIQSALEKLERYRLDYSVLNSAGHTEAAAVYVDQRLFLQRVDANIMALRNQYMETCQLLDNARDLLKAVSDKSEVLSLAISRKMDLSETHKQRRLQSECDETGRIINGRLKQRNSRH